MDSVTVILPILEPPTSCLNKRSFSSDGAATDLYKSLVTPSVAVGLRGMLTSV
jgi:hypothetical protein